MLDVNQSSLLFLVHFVQNKIFRIRGSLVYVCSAVNKPSSCISPEDQRRLTTVTFALPPVSGPTQARGVGVEGGGHVHVSPAKASLVSCKQLEAAGLNTA